MTNKRNEFRFGKTAVALAIASAFTTCAFAADDELAALTQPSSSVSAGVGSLSGNTKERSIFGQYNGMRRDDTAALLDVDTVRRDEATGTWITIQGTNLGLDTREFNAGIEKQGDWKLGVNYDEITHREIRTINTANTGVGTTTPSVVALPVARTVTLPATFNTGASLANLNTPTTASIFGNGSDMDLKLQRKATSLIGEKWLSPSLLFEFTFKNEDKDGARMSGKGYACGTYVCTASGTQISSVLLMQAEPVNTNTKQLDMKLVFNSDKFNGQVGYYGSFFKNSNGSVNMQMPANNQLYGGDGATLRAMASAASISTGNSASPVVINGLSLSGVMALPFALPPDNEAHQFFAAGNYAFTEHTKGTFKVAYTHATQNESFSAMGLTGQPAGSGNGLNGELNTTLLQLGVTSKPIPKLSLNANVRYENREDKTPKYLYNTELVTTAAAAPAAVPPTLAQIRTDNWYNADTSSRKLSGKLEATYQLPANLRATAGVDYKELKREVPTSFTEDKVAGINVLRAKNDETNYRLELAGALAETFSGSVAYIYGQRRGSDWTSLATATYAQSLSSSAVIAGANNAIFPISMADIDREKWKMTANWSPVEQFALQFLVESYNDRNKSVSHANYGVMGARKTGGVLYSLDATLSLSEKWQLNAFASHGRQSLDQYRAGSTTGYALFLDNDSDMFGLGIVGKLTSKLDVGLNATFLNDKTRYGVDDYKNSSNATPTAVYQNQANIGLPDVLFRQSTANLFAKYDLDQNSNLRADLIYQRSELNEWSWSNNGIPFAYSDGTTVTINPKQDVLFAGVRYTYKWK